MKETKDILVEATRRLNRNRPFAMVTIIRTSGSTPRKEGSRMLVDPGGNITGSIGGAAVERIAVGRALKCLETGVTEHLELDLNDVEHLQTGMVCGGQVELLIEPFGSSPRLLLFGAGHVAQPTARLATELGFSVELFDARSEWITAERFPTAKLNVGSTEELAAQCETREEDFIAVMTYCHDEDYKVVRKLLRKPFRYLGVIGSKRKAVEIKGNLQAEGFQAEEIDRLTCPIGIEIGSHTPLEVAISIAAQLVKIQQGGGTET